MVLIPGGEFQMGEEGFGDHSPVHWVRVDPFHLDVHEVTNAQYLAFCEATERRLPEFWGLAEFHSGPEYPDHPVVGVSWSDAMAYARWRGARLPTEAEWEYAARGGLLGRNYSHGDTLHEGLYAPRGVTGKAAPSPVASFPPNGFGLHDMTGNVLEWVHDWYDPDFYTEETIENPWGPGHGKFRVVRGGGWHTGPSCSRVYVRTGLQGNWLDINVGFRCAKYVGSSAAECLDEQITTSGIEVAMSEHERMRTAERGEFFYDEGELNDLGYRLLGDGKTVEAVAVFAVAVELFPASYNAHDSLGEAYLAQGNREEAIRHYRRSVELHPGNRGGREKLRELLED